MHITDLLEACPVAPQRGRYIVRQDGGERDVTVRVRAHERADFVERGADVEGLGVQRQSQGSAVSARAVQDVVDKPVVHEGTTKQTVHHIVFASYALPTPTKLSCS